MVVVIGVDTHKATHTFVAVDEVGRRLDELTIGAVTAGHMRALGWARETLNADLIWAVEDCRNLSLRLERDLLAAGQRVVRVPPRLMAYTQASSRTPGKSDALDALAVARAALREPDLPVAMHDEISRELKLLVDRREDLIKHRSATICRLLWRVHELDPSHAPKVASLDRAKTHRELGAWLMTEPGLVAELARNELGDITLLTAEINALEKCIGVRVRAFASSLLTIYGVCRVDGSQDRGRSRRSVALQQRGRLRLLCRAGSHPVVLGRATGAEEGGIPGRKSSASHRTAPYRNLANRPP